MKTPPIPIHDSRFQWISSATHDAGSDAFRERQRARMVAAQGQRQQESERKAAFSTAQGMIHYFAREHAVREAAKRKA